MSDPAKQGFDAASAEVGIGQGKRGLVIKRPIFPTEPSQGLVSRPERLIRRSDHPHKAEKPVGLNRIQRLSSLLSALEGPTRQNVTLDSVEGEMRPLKEVIDRLRWHASTHHAHDVEVGPQRTRHRFATEQFLNTSDSCQDALRQNADAKSAFC